MNERQKICCFGHLVIDNKPFDPLFSAGQFNQLWNVGSNFRQLGVFPDNDAGDHGCQRVHVSDEIAFGF